MELIQNRVCHFKELSPQCKEHAESIDIIVPDVSPDVLEILCATGSCTIREKQAGASAVTMTGDIYIKVYYTSEDDGRLYSLGGHIPYSYTCEAPGALPGDAVIATVQVVSATATALNPRKLSLKAEVCADARIYQPAAIEINEDAAGEHDEGIQTLTATENCRLLAAVAEKRIAFNEEIRLMTGDIAETDRVLRGELTWFAEDIKVLAGKIMLRGSAAVKAVTMPENGGRPTENTYKLPFSCIVECDAADEGDEVRVEFQTLQFETQLITRGENELYLYCNIFGNAAVFVEKNTELTLLEDIFSTDYTISYETEEVPGGLCEPETLQTDASAVIELEVPASAVCDWSYCARAACAADMISGSFYFKVMYENQNGKLMCAARRIDVEMPGECADCCVEASAEHVSVAVDAVGAIQISFTAVFTVRPDCAQPRRQIKSCRVDREKPLGRVRDASLVLRAIEPQETVWGIAKQYRTSPAAILSANRLESESELKPGKLIIIPFVV